MFWVTPKTVTQKQKTDKTPHELLGARHVLTLRERGQSGRTGNPPRRRVLPAGSSSSDG